MARWVSPEASSEQQQGQQLHRSARSFDRHGYHHADRLLAEERQNGHQQHLLTSPLQCAPAGHLIETNLVETTTSHIKKLGQRQDNLSHSVSLSFADWKTRSDIKPLIVIIDNNGKAMENGRTNGIPRV